MAIAIKSATVTASAAAPVSVTTSEAPSATASGDVVVVIHGNDYYALTNMATPTATGSPTMNSIVNADGGTEVVKLDEASGSDCQAAGSSFRGSLIQADSGSSRIFGSWVVANLVGCCCRAASRVWERCRAVSPARP